MSAKVTNHSSKASDYMITVVVESADGKTRYDHAYLFATALAPGQTTTPDAPITATIPPGAVVRVSDVLRIASK